MRTARCSGHLSCHAGAPPPPLRLRAVTSAGVIGKVAEAGDKVNRKEESLG